MCFYVWLCAPVSTCSHEVLMKRTLDALELELLSTWVLGTQLWPSARAASTITTGPIQPLHPAFYVSSRNELKASTFTH